MRTLQLKNALIQKISEIEDRFFLEAIKTILEAKLALNKNAKHKTHNFRNIKTLITWIFAKFTTLS
jgi:hypothetical protein